MTRSSRPARAGAGLVAALCVALGACTAARDPSGASLEESVPALPDSGMQALASPTTRAPVSAVAALPEEAGAVVSVRGHGYVDGFRQDILLKGSRVRGVENGITVLMRTSRQETLDERVPLVKPTEAAIRTEIGRAFPHIAMQVVERPSSNASGAYGLALGRAGGTIHCVYMWQWIDEGSLPRDMPGPASVRVRLCRADTTFDALAALLDHLTIRRDAGPETVAAAIIDPPEPATEPHRHLAAHVKRRPRRPAPAVAIAAPVAVATSVAYAPATARPSAVDLPPQAFLGPTAHPLEKN